MGVHTLITGLNGAGKTLYTVATKLRPLADSTIKYKGVDIPRRLVVGGIPELLIEHELMEVPEIDPERFVDEWATVKRDAAEHPVRWVRKAVTHEKSGAMGYLPCEEHDPGAEPVVCSAVNWWVWCKPGDVIVIDECQRLFRPMASGRRVPMFIAQLEIARHYGVEFIYLTQHPQLLHVNVRNLVGPHEDVRRIFGSGRVMVYQWDKVSNPDRIAKATGKVWKHDKTAFGLYRSSQLHTNFSQRLPLALLLVVPAVLALVALLWYLKQRSEVRFDPKASAAPAAQVAASAAQAKADEIPPSEVQPKAWPIVPTQAKRLEHEPYAGRALQIEGGYIVDGQPVAYFGLIQDGRRIASITLAELVRAGYSYTALAPCSGLLRFGERERVLSCGAPSEAHDKPAAPTPAASQPVTA